MAVVPGLTAGQYYNPATGQVPQGYSMGVPRDPSRGGMQQYDPRYAYQLPSQQPSTARYANQQTGGSGSGSMARYDQWKPKTTTPKPAGGAASLPWQGGSDLFTPQNPFTGITTSITPRAPYSPEQTLAATNQAVAQHHASGNINDVMKRFDSPGISRGAAHVARALPIAAQANQAARRTRAQLPMEDFFANQQSILGGQTAREQEAIALAQQSIRQQANQQQLRFGQARQQLDNLGAGFNFVDALMGL